MIIFGMMMEGPERHGNWLSLQRGCMHDDVNQLYACGSVTGWTETETETELTCDTEHNIYNQLQSLLMIYIHLQQL